MVNIDAVVKETYTGTEKEPLEFYRIAVSKLGLPPFLTTPVVDKAFRSHLEYWPAPGNSCKSR